MTIFKAGDKVYSPKHGSRIFTLVKTDDLYSCDTDYPLYLSAVGVFEGVREDGKLSDLHYVTSIFHATKENREKLEALYGVEFEKTKRKLKGSELCKHLLKTKNHVFCLVSDTCDADAIENSIIRCVTSYDPNEKYIFAGLDSRGYAYSFAVPIDLETLEPLEMEINDE